LTTLGYSMLACLRVSKASAVYQSGEQPELDASAPPSLSTVGQSRLRAESASGSPRVAVTVWWLANVIENEMLWQRADELTVEGVSWGRGSTVAIDCAVPRREEDAAPSHSQASITRGLPSIPSIASLHASPGHGYVDHSSLRDMQARPPAGAELLSVFCSVLSSYLSVCLPPSVAPARWSRAWCLDASHQARTL